MKQFRVKKIEKIRYDGEHQIYFIAQKRLFGFLWWYNFNWGTHEETFSYEKDAIESVFEEAGKKIKNKKEQITKNYYYKKEGLEEAKN